MNLTEARKKRLLNPKVRPLGRYESATSRFDSPEESRFIRIENGVALLNKTVGPNWPVLINLDTFDIGQGSRCVLGQVFVGADGQGYDYGKGALRTYVKEHNINSRVEEVLFEHHFLDVERVGMDGGSVGTDDWKPVIRFLQEHLVGSVDAATEARKSLATEYEVMAKDIELPAAERSWLRRAARHLRRGGTGTGY